MRKDKKSLLKKICCRELLCEKTNSTCWRGVSFICGAAVTLAIFLCICAQQLCATVGIGVILLVFLVLMFCCNFCKNKLDSLGWAILLVGVLISWCLIYLCFLDFNSKLDTNLQFEVDVAGTIAAIGAFITAFFIYRQFRDTQRQFSLTSIQNAFFSLYGAIKQKEDNSDEVALSGTIKQNKNNPDEVKLNGKIKHEEDNSDKIKTVIPLLDLLVRNLDDGTLVWKNADYYLNLVFELAVNKNKLFVDYSGTKDPKKKPYSIKYKVTLDKIKEDYGIT